eukprot:TRINITY_DN5566_c0_g1_i1.p1 TRINITY_DN5566_c0_g1~~TRINITY_DN5566_c0_g1_i1.p1  ORF type:complete len:286 (+),score=62.72 TRINITY_DN5566_c0_g1_i1:83-859(+)
MVVRAVTSSVSNEDDSNGSVIADYNDDESSDENISDSLSGSLLMHSNAHSIPEGWRSESKPFVSDGDSSSLLENESSKIIVKPVNHGIGNHADNNYHVDEVENGTEVDSASSSFAPPIIDVTVESCTIEDSDQLQHQSSLKYGPKSLTRQTSFQPFPSELLNRASKNQHGIYSHLNIFNRQNLVSPDELYRLARWKRNLKQRNIGELDSIVDKLRSQMAGYESSSTRIMEQLTNIDGKLSCAIHRYQILSLRLKRLSK